MPKGIGYGPETREGKRQAFIESMRAKTAPKAKPRKKKPVSRGKKLRRTIKELIGGSKTYLPKEKTRTDVIKRKLRRNLTKQEIARFGGK